MKLGIFLTATGGIIIVMFLGLPLYAVFDRWLGTGIFSADWFGMWKSLAIGFFLGAIPFVSGMNRIKKIGKVEDA